MNSDRPLQTLFYRQLTEITEVLQNLSILLKEQELAKPVREELHHQVHKLVGSSGVMGYQKISSMARVLEEKLDPENETSENRLASNQLIDHFENLLDAIRTDEADTATASKPSVRNLYNNPDRASKLIYLFEDDSIQAADISIQVENYGYRVKTFDQLDQLKQVISQRLPDAILMDVAFPEGRMAGPKAILALRKEINLEIPVIFLSASDHFASRLQAVRAGSAAFFLKPVDTISLIDTLDRLTNHDHQEAYRILLVEDSTFQAAFYAQILEDEGMQTRVTTQPAKILEVMAEFNPDLILLDVHMPDCSGMELAHLVRQAERFVSIPIVYLSAEQNKEVQLRAMSQGGDDFLSKPIKPEHLIAAIHSRVTRYRILRSFMVHDGLTGLLNHTTINAYLEKELARAQRQNVALSFVMIDLDNFKLVNDNYGHPTGDRVLKSLARLLKQRLRRADIIGRYGGEEFALILPDTPGENARFVMEDLRRRFGKITHQAGDQYFRVTLSCGIAAYPDYTSAGEIKDAADQALYKAKRAGRDQIAYLRPVETASQPQA
ncbi:MAG: diguanylate cyclase [Chloroflexi bacterium HGW-Chloroflexi-10]|nr:MAG: diguanylate cyclase [Chloroflexi bacterium HGW-Chloroflexi-10]